MQSAGSLMSTRCQHHCVSLASPQNPRNKLLYCRQTGKRILLLYERQRLPLESTQLQRNSRARTLESDKFVIACKNVSMKKITLLRTWRRVLLDNSSSSQAFFWNLGTGTTPTASFLSSRRLFTPGKAKWHEHTCDEAVGSHFARFDFTKSTHFFLLASASLRLSLKKGILWREIPFSGSFTFEHP